MKKRATKADRTVPLELTIYALIDDETKEVYIGKYRSARLREAYRRHLKLGYNETFCMCYDLQEQGQLPSLYVLEEITATKVQAYRHQLAWLRYFTEHGYWRDSDDATTYYTAHMLPATQALYDRIAELKITDICSSQARPI